MSRPVRVLLVHQYAIVREAFRSLFEKVDDIRIGDVAADDLEAIECLRRERFDIVLASSTVFLGVKHSGVIEAISRRHRNISVIILAASTGIRQAQQAIEAGVAGYLTKDCSTAELFVALRKVGSGGRYVTPIIAEEIVFSKVHGKAAEIHDNLTERELQIMRMLGHGYRNKDIAIQLKINVKTVSTHKAKIMEKMAFSATTDIVSYVVSHDLL